MYSPVSSPHDPDLLLVSSDMGSLYRSEDGGGHWQTVQWHQAESALRTAPHFHPTDPNVIYSCSFHGGPVLRVSRDRGKTWAPVCDDPPWFDGVQTELVARYRPYLKRLTRPIPGIASDEEDGDFMFLSHEERAFRSRDGGRTWVELEGLKGLPIGFYVDPTSPRDKRVCFAATNEGVYRSDDGGETWSEKSNGLPWRGLNGFCAGADTGTGRVALYCIIPSRVIDGTFAGGVFRSTDRGETWESALGKGLNLDIGRQKSKNKVDQYRNIAMARSNPDVVYMTNTGTGYWPPHNWTIYRTDDGGETWRATYFGERSELNRGPERNVEVGWLVYDLDYGWGGNLFYLSVNPTNPDHVLCSNMAELFRTTDGGKRWSQCFTRHAPGQGAPGKGHRWESCGMEVSVTSRQYFDPTDPERMYVALQDFGFIRSEDRGKSWRLSVDGCPWANSFYELAFDEASPGTIYAACSVKHMIPYPWHMVHDDPDRPPSGGICKSSDYGKSWVTVSEGLPNAPATSVVLDPKSPKEQRVLYAAMRTRGVYRSTDSARTWSLFSDGLPLKENPYVFALQLHADGSLFCMVTGKPRTYDAPGGLFRLPAGGGTWEYITESCEQYYPVQFDVHPEDSAIIYFAAHSITTPAGKQGGVYRTADGGKSWERLLSDEDFAKYPFSTTDYVHGYAPAIHPKNPDIVLLTTGTHGLFYSTDVGQTWKPDHTFPTRWTRHITWDPNDINRIYVTTGGTGTWVGPCPVRV